MLIAYYGLSRAADIQYLPINQKIVFIYTCFEEVTIDFFANSSKDINQHEACN